MDYQTQIKNEIVIKITEVGKKMLSKLSWV
jgi:hypothetical protein